MAAKLQRQSSLPVACGGGGLWCGRTPSSGGFQRAHLGARGDAAGRPAGVGGLVRGLWRRIVRQKRRVLRQKGAAAPEQYDHEAYAQNFEEEAASPAPENLYRSFSARYAGPARAL